MCLFIIFQMWRVYACMWRSLFNFFCLLLLIHFVYTSNKNSKKWHFYSLNQRNVFLEFVQKMLFTLKYYKLHSIKMIKQYSIHTVATIHLKIKLISYHCFGCQTTFTVCNCWRNFRKFIQFYLFCVFSVKTGFCLNLKWNCLFAL